MLEGIYRPMSTQSTAIKPTPVNIEVLSEDGGNIQTIEIEYEHIIQAIQQGMPFMKVEKSTINSEEVDSEAKVSTQRTGAKNTRIKGSRRSSSSRSKVSVATKTSVSSANSGKHEQASWPEKSMNFPAVPFIHLPKQVKGSTQNPGDQNLPKLPVNRKIGYKLERSREWDDSSLSIMDSFHPRVKELKVFDKSNSHPLAASSRNIMEAYALSKAVQHIVSTNTTRGWVLDVGGNAYRHYYARREFVWSSNPRMST